MILRPFLRYRAGAPVALLIACLTGSAADAASVNETADEAEDDQAIETIVVTAHRTPVALADVGSAVSVVGRDDIDNRQQAFVADLLRDVPGVSLSRTSTNGSITQVRVRGAEANHLLVVIDGVEVNDPASGDEFNFGALTSYDIESIELVRGPQSALWGSDAMAGILNIRTRSAREPLLASAFVEGGSFGTISGGGRLGASSDRGAITLNASRFETDGVSAAASGREKDGYENTTVGLNGRYAFTDAFRVGVAGRYTEDRIEFDGTADGIPVDANNETDNEQALLSIDGSLTLLGGRWDNVLRYTYLDTEADTVGEFPATIGAKKHGAYLQSTLFLGRASSMDRHRVTLGADYEDEDYRQRSAFADQDQSLDNVGVVLEYYGKPVEGFNLSASVRYDDNSDFRGVATYRGTLSWLVPGLRTRLKGSVGTGQKRPSFTERFGFSPDFFIGNPDLKPERNEGFDIGIEQPLWGDRLRFGMTYFNERLKDEIQLVGFPSTPINLDGKSRREGVEVDLTAELSAYLVLTANYTYTDSKQPDSTGEQDAREIRRPRHQAAVNLNHAFWNGNGNLNLNLSYTGSQKDTVFSFPPQTVTLSAYTLANVTADWRVADWLTLFGRAENLFDEAQQDVFGFRSPGRGFHFGFRVGTGR